jgi:hypothetical protein
VKEPSNLFGNTSGLQTSLSDSNNIGLRIRSLRDERNKRKMSKSINRDSSVGSTEKKELS